jgi:DNA-binding response OmpR family regulator
VAKILVVEDERPLAKILKFNLEKEGHAVVLAADGPSGAAAALDGKPDLVILDVMLPGMDGFEVCRKIRAARKTTPILMLTARKEEVDRVLGLELGADDYVTKPFSPRELMARVKALLRRSGAGASEAVMLRAGTIELDSEKWKCRVSGQEISLRQKEFEFLKLLLESGGKVLTRDDLLEKVWGYDRSMELDTRTVDQHIARLREKLGKESARIETVKGVGYRLKRD